MSELTRQLGQFAGSPSHALIDEDLTTPANAVLLDDVRGKPPTEAELAQEYVAPGDEALLPLGVLYQADWKRYGDGMARHAREQVTALASTGFPVALQSIYHGGQLDGELHPDVVSKVGALPRVTLGSIGIAIRQAVIHNSDFLLGLVCPKGARVMEFDVQKRVYESTIVYTSWERSMVHPSIVEILKRCGQVWVPCRANHDAFVESGLPLDKVTVVPCPYDPATNPVCKIPLPYGREHVPSGKRFYAIGKWEPRKEYDRLIGAFLLGFTPKDRASLMLKTHGWDTWEGYPSVQESLKKWFDDPRVKSNGWTVEKAQRQVRVVTKRITDAEMSELHRTNNIYVSSSHGEAWELGAFDARCAGNRLVYVGYGGADEYAGKEDVSIPFDLGPVDKNYGWEPGAQWAHYAMDALIEAMRKAEPPTRRIHPPELYARFGKGPVGERMKVLILQLAEKLNPALGHALVEAGGYA